MPNHLLRTIAGTNFHLHSSADNNILMFGTENNIHKLSEESHLCMDGTFKSVPDIYHISTALHYPYLRRRQTHSNLLFTFS